jgi:hypothetical protein
MIINQAVHPDETDEGPARVKQNTKDNNNNNNINPKRKGPDKNEKGFQISSYIYACAFIRDFRGVSSFGCWQLEEGGIDYGMQISLVRAARSVTRRFFLVFSILVFLSKNKQRVCLVCIFTLLCLACVSWWPPSEKQKTVWKIIKTRRHRRDLAPAARHTQMAKTKVPPPYQWSVLTPSIFSAQSCDVVVILRVWVEIENFWIFQKAIFFSNGPPTVSTFFYNCYKSPAATLTLIISQENFFFVKK